jgi:hypothetical protein
VRGDEGGSGCGRAAVECRSVVDSREAMSLEADRTAFGKATSCDTRNCRKGWAIGTSSSGCAEPVRMTSRCGGCHCMSPWVDREIDESSQSGASAPQRRLNSLALQGGRRWTEMLRLATFFAEARRQVVGKRRAELHI